MSHRVDYDDRQWQVYERGRGISPERRALWSRVLGRHVERGSAVLDLGCGTGVYSELVAEELDATVTGVEPSARMRAAAERNHPHPRVRYLAGAAENIPLPDASCDAALLSNVLHHIADVDAAAAELARVVKPGGRLLIRGALDGARLTFLDYFPTARPIAADQMPSAATVIASFTAAVPFDHLGTERVQQATAPSLSAYVDRIALRAISTLELIDDEEFERGVERMRRAAKHETGPVVDEIDLLVLRRTG